MAYDSKGLAIGYGNLFVNEKILLSWSDVVKRIDALIKQDKYLSEKEQTLLDWYERSQVARAIQGFYMNRDEEVPRPFTHDVKAVYEDKAKEIIPQIEDSERFAEIYAVMREIFESDLPNTRNYDYQKVALKRSGSMQTEPTICSQTLISARKQSRRQKKPGRNNRRGTCRRDS